MSNFSNPADPCAVYLSELEQLETKLRSLRERAMQARRSARDTHAIYWAHVSEMQHLNTKLAEVLASWQVETNGKAVVR
ncbi:hypothetical protein HUU05_08705 [candidate division KSB1 bacterium]|nr:hypothetical protein [candidate division KSB1 bacterium]